MNLLENPARRAPYIGLLVFSGFATLAAALTLLPWEAASWPNIWGYRSLCTFAPGATVACALVAALSCILRNRLVNQQRDRPLVPLVVVGALVALLVWSTVSWAEAKAFYTDANTAATESGEQDQD